MLLLSLVVLERDVPAMVPKTIKSDVMMAGELSQVCLGRWLLAMKRSLCKHGVDTNNNVFSSPPSQINASVQCKSLDGRQS
jgi:hypothetical protein